MTRLKFLAVPGGCLVLIGQIGACLFHVWTIILAYQVSGFVGAALSFFMPVLAEIWWVIVFWRKVGPLNLYTLAMVAVVAMYVIGGLLAYLADDSKEES